MDSSLDMKLSFRPFTNGKLIDSVIIQVPETNSQISVMFVAGFLPYIFVPSKFGVKRYSPPL